MTPDDFMAALAAHFRNNHESDDMAARWYDDYVTAIGGYSPDVLRKIAVDVIQERKTKSFPLIGEIREIASRHLQRSYDEPAKTYCGSRRAPESWEQTERYRKAKEWRDRVTAPYGGNMDAYLTATAGRRQGGLRTPSASKRSTFSGLSATSIRMTGGDE